MNLRKQTINGIKWATFQQFGTKIFGLIFQIILARLLSPEDFAPVALLTIFIALGTALTDAGLTSSLIRNGNVDDRDFSTVFWINIFGSIIIYLILFFIAPFIADFYEMPIMKDVVRVYCMSIIINAFSNVQNTRLATQMNFKTQANVAIPAILISGLIGIICAYVGMEVWAIIIMGLSQSVLKTIILWRKTNWRPQLVFDKKRFKQHFSFSYKISISSIIDVLFSNVYTILIGKQYTPDILGFYNRADTLRLFPIQNLSSALNTVTYPMFSKIQNDETKLKDTYRRIMKLVVFIFAPVYVLLILTAEPLVFFVLGEKWLPLVPYFQLLCIPSILYPFHVYNLNILKVKGRSDLFLYIEIVKRILTVIGILIVFSFGIYGLLYFQIVNSFLAYFINSFYSGKMINYNVWRQLGDLSIYILLAFGVGLLVYFSRQWLFIEAYWVNLLYSTILFIGLYILISRLARLPALIELKNIVLRK